MTGPSPKDALAAAEIPAVGKAPETDPLIGRVISDRFRIVAPIARGGMGVVYKAEQAPLGRLVAIKILSLKHDETKDPEFRKRFFLEAATVAKLTHPNTVTVFDYGQDHGGLYYIAMELVNGRTLKKALAAEGPFPPPRAVHIAKQICRSLREAHRLGVIHRDMKPGNVMLVDRDGEDHVKVLDFGLVKQVDNNPDEDLTQAGVFMGSPKYMAPEQIQGEAVDGRTDIYAVGVVLYEMLTGRVPFQHDNQMQILTAHIRDPVPPMTTPAGVPPIPPELQAIVFKCLEKKPENRYGDMEALLHALKSVGLDGGVISSSSKEIDLSLSTSAGTPVSGVHTMGAAGTSGAAAPATAHSPTTLAPPPASRVPLVIASIALVAAIGIAAVFALRGGDPSPAIAGGGRVPASARPATATDDSADRGTRGSAEGGASAATTTEDATARAEAGPGQPQTGRPAPRTLLLSLRSTPPGATVRIGPREYGPTPAQVELVGDLAAEGQEIEMIFERAGYRSARVKRVVESASMEVDVRLTPIRRPSSPSPASVPERRIEGYRDSPY
jgi:serine/threonine-protein kinase